MKYTTLIPVYFKGKASELPVSLDFDNDVHTIQALVGSTIIAFQRNGLGAFIVSEEYSLAKEYITMLEKQLDRMFGD